MTTNASPATGRFTAQVTLVSIHRKATARHLPWIAGPSGPRDCSAVDGRGFGGMLCIQVKGGAEAALNVVKRCKVFTRATSLGGVESLIEHRYTIEGEGSPVPRDWLRLSIGIESVDDLIADLEQALG